MVVALDISGVDDVLPSLGTVTGRRALAECSCRRLTTRHGSLFYDRDFGHDVRQYLNAPVLSTGQVSHDCATELEKDERVDSAQVVVTQIGSVLRLDITLNDGVGPFDFTLTVDAVSAALSV